LQRLIDGGRDAGFVATIALAADPEATSTQALALTRKASTRTFA
jgi:hypothetical protein